MSKIASNFKYNTRQDGTGYFFLSDAAPEWLSEAVQEAHDGELPNDWRYKVCAFVAESIDEANEDGEEFDPTNIADSLVDVYTHDLIAWLAGNVRRVADVDQAMEQGQVGNGGIEEQIRFGQYFVIEQMASILWDAVCTANEEVNA